MRFPVDGTIWTPLDERIRQTFAQLVERCESCSLARLSLQVAAAEYREMLVEAMIDKVAKIATTVSHNLPDDATDLEKIQALNIQLFEIMNFWGDPSEFYDVKSCYLNEVLQKRTGLPVTLAMLYFDLAERLDLGMTIVSLPGHFLLRYAASDGGGEFFVDPFNRGAIRDRAGCRELLRHFTRGRMPWSDEYLEPVDHRRMLTHHLYDIKGAYARAGDNARVLRVLNYLLTLHPGDGRTFRERGLLLADLDLVDAAIEDLEAFLSLGPDDADRAKVEALIAQIRGG